jgi:hypothetical protein
MRYSILFLSLFVLSACLNDSRAPAQDTHSSFEFDNSAQETFDNCEDFLHRNALMFDRCELARYSEALPELYKMVDGSCWNVKDIRDISELYSCVLWLQTVDCDYVKSEFFSLDSSCERQLLME